MTSWINKQFQNLGMSNNNNNNNNKYNKRQMQKQTYMKDQGQQTVQTQMMIECVQNAIKTVVLAAKLFKANQLDESTINVVSDNAIQSLNLFAANCEDLYQQRDHYTLDLMQKQASDQFGQLKQDNVNTYNLIEPHRNFINAALNGQKNLRYKTERVESSSEHLFDNNTDTINQVFARMVGQSQKYDKRTETYAEPQKNQHLKKRHQSAHDQYRNNDKYKKTQNQQKYVRPKQSDLYFTQSGKNSKFIDEQAAIRKQAEHKAMDEDLYEPEADVYDILHERQAEQKEVYPYNAVWKLSSKNRFKPSNSKMVIKKPICCQILWPDQQNVNRDKTMIMIAPCYPWNKETRLVKIEELDLDLKQIVRAEGNHINKYGQLGYKSIECWKKEAPNDTDYTMNGM